MSNKLTVVLATSMIVALGFLVLTAPTDTDRVQALGQQIKCPVCQGESIGDSPAQMARDMMSLVAQRVDEGRTDDEIVDELLGSYSGAVLLDPPASGATLLLWIAPLLAVVAGAVVIGWWRRHPGPPESAVDGSNDRKPRRLGTILFLAGALGVIVVVAGFAIQDNDNAAGGIAVTDPTNLEEVSNETMMAVIAANADHPEVDGMKLALADRYFEAGDFSSAFPFYLEVAESPNATDSQAVDALVHLGWMAWDGNQEADTALGLFDQALSIDSQSTTAMYLKGQVLWCAAVDHERAADLFKLVLAQQDLPDDTRDIVESDLAALDSGVGCQ